MNEKIELLIDRLIAKTEDGKLPWSNHSSGVFTTQFLYASTRIMVTETNMAIQAAGVDAECISIRAAEYPRLIRLREIIKRRIFNASGVMDELLRRLETL